MTTQENHPNTPAWLTFATGAINAMQYRSAPQYPIPVSEDDPVGEFLGAPDPLPPMVNLSKEWDAMRSAGDPAFSIMRTRQIGATLELLSVLRLCATLKNYQTADALTDPAAISSLDVGHPDWIQPVTRALQDLLPDHTLIYAPEERRKGDLLVVAPSPSQDMGIAKDAARFAETISEALQHETPMLLITAGLRALPDRTARLLPPAIRLAPLDADIVLAMLHLRFEDGDAGCHEDLRRRMPAPDMLARLDLDALHAAFRGADGAAIVRKLREQGEALTPTDGQTLDQLGGGSEAVAMARQMVADLKLWTESGLPWSETLHSMLLHGKPGTGKTHLARAMGRSSGLPLIQASFARWQSCGHLGDMLKAMQSTFTEAIAAAPCILFIDEIDAAGSRESDEMQNTSYRRQVINGFLEQVDIAMRAEGILIVGACNNMSALDPAILRPGRFDSLIEVPLPGRAALSAMFRQQLGHDLADSDLAGLVAAAIGATPAMIDSSIRAARSRARALRQPLQISDIITCLHNGETPDPALMWRIAIHECGHAVVAIERCLGTIRHVRIGMRDGHTSLLTDLGAGLLRDHENLLAYVLAGRAAESILFGSTGSGSGGFSQSCDLASANRIALGIETAFGFGTDGLIWSPGEITERIADPVLRAAVRNRLDKAEADARRVLHRHEVLLLEMAKNLLRHRILEGSVLQIWIDRITGDASWDPDDPSGRQMVKESDDSCEYDVDGVLLRHRIGAS